MPRIIRSVSVEVKPAEYFGRGTVVEVRARTECGGDYGSCQAIGADHFRSFFRQAVDAAVEKIESALKD